METKPLAFGIIGFLLGGLIVSIAATQLDNNDSMTDANDMTMSQMSHNLQGKTGDDFDKAFIAGMIEHHQGAIDMAKSAQQNAKHDEIKKMANDIIAAQSREIDMMQAWQTDWGYKTMPWSHSMSE